VKENVSFLNARMNRDNISETISDRFATIIDFHQRNQSSLILSIKQSFLLPRLTAETVLISLVAVTFPRISKSHQ
jgi:hypothetical protein